MAYLLTIVADTGADLKRLRRLKKVAGELIGLYRVDIEDPPKKLVTLLPPTWLLGHRDAGKLGHFALGDDHSSERFKKILKVIGSKNVEDALHLEAAARSGMAYFVTNNRNDFITEGKREDLKHFLPGINIVEMDELEQIVHSFVKSHKSHSIDSITP